MSTGSVVVDHQQHRDGCGWRWWAAWLIASTVLVVAVVGLASIGLFLFPIGLVCIGIVWWRSPHLSEASGVVGGIGIALLIVAFRNRGSTPCDGGESVVVQIPAQSQSGSSLSGTVSISCGGLDPTPFFVAGTGLIGISALIFAVSQLVRHRA